MKKVPVALIGARGYAGRELTRLLLRHPGVHLQKIYSQHSAPSAEAFDLSEIPQTPSSRPLRAENLDSLRQTWLANSGREAGLGELTFFLATSCELSLELAPRLLELGCHVIDLSGAFRLQPTTERSSDEELLRDFQHWYGLTHSAPQLLRQAIYGLHPWLSRTALGKNKPYLVANPGCYATAILLALLPLLRDKIVAVESVVIDAKSGVSGAGRTPQTRLMFAEVAEDCLAYRVGEHQHLPEIATFVEHYAECGNFSPFMVTHLLPLRRGLVATIFARPHARLTQASQGELAALLNESYAAAYSTDPLIQFGPATPQLLSLQAVANSPRAHLSFTVKENKIYLFSALDNLLKGAAAQAVQNFNYLHGFAMNEGLNT